MSKVAVVFWSGTGNTGVMATNVAEGAKEAGAQADVIFVSDFSADKMDEYDAIDVYKRQYIVSGEKYNYFTKEYYWV